MPDLSPDTSIYSTIAKSSQSGLGSMDLGSLLGVAGRARELQTQQAVSDALRASGGDVNAAMKGLLQPGSPGYVTPDLISGMTQAAQHQADLQKFYATQVGHDVGTLITNPKLSRDDILQRIPTWKRYGVPDEVIGDILHNVIRPDGSVNKSGLATIKNWADNNATLPMAPQETLPSGQTQQRPAGSTMYDQPGGGGGTGTAGGAPGSVVTSLPSGAGATKEAAAADARQLVNSGPALANNRSSLLSLQDLSDKAATGPTAGLEKEISQLAQRFGFRGTMTQEQLGATEGYAKIAGQLQQQMAVNGFGAVGGGHATDAFLANAQSAMPNLQLSRLGRQGITHWLLGNNDAMMAMQQEWAKWIGAHPNREGDYYAWQNGQLPDADGKGFDIAKFDPRVFQYERMTPEEQGTFRSMIKGRGELTRFANNVKEYEQRGWIGPHGVSAQ